MTYRDAVYYDTSAWIALYDHDDDCHEEAVEHHNHVLSGKKVIVTYNFVFSETHAFFCRFPREALRVCETIRSSRVVSLQRVLAEDEEKAWMILKKYKDKEFSFCDVTSFAMIARLEIPFAFTFDDHFRQYGISVLEINEAIFR